MADLKTLRNRISSVKSTQKITKAMKMVAASKLRKAQLRAEEARPYSERMERMLATLAASMPADLTPEMLSGHKQEDGSIKDDTHLLIVATSVRGLCGGFNTSIVRAVRDKVTELTKAGKTAKLITVGKKGYEQLKYGYEDWIVEHREGSKSIEIEYAEAEDITAKLISMFDAGEIDSCSIVYNKFVSAIAQEVTFQSLIPMELSTEDTEEAAPEGAVSVYEYEPDEDAVLTDLIPRNITVQVYHSLLENMASEQAARMTAMDNATRNANDMIDNLTLQYNRSRQAAITTELIEIISGAESLHN